MVIVNASSNIYSYHYLNHHFLHWSGPCHLKYVFLVAYSLQYVSRGCPLSWCGLWAAHFLGVLWAGYASPIALSATIRSAHFPNDGPLGPLATCPVPPAPCPSHPVSKLLHTQLRLHKQGSRDRLRRDAGRGQNGRGSVATMGDRRRK